MSEISDETVNVFLRAAVAAGAGAYISGGEGRIEVDDEQVRAGLAALVASGYRREADVLRETGRRWLQLAVDTDWLKTWLSAHGLGLDAGPAGVLAAVGRDFLAYSTKFGPLEPSLPLPVAAGSAVLDVHKAALQEIDRVVGNDLTLSEVETTRIRGILSAALSEEHA